MIKNFFRNKYGDEKFFSLWWFVMIGVVAVLVIVSIWVYYSASVDVRQNEASILNERLASCLIEKGSIKEEVLKKDFDIYKFCNLNSQVFSKEGGFYFNISLKDENITLKEINSDSLKIKQDCDVVLGTGADAKKYPTCLVIYHIVNYNNKEVKIGILSASNQIGEKTIV